MATAVITANQMTERLREIAASAGIDVRMSVRLTTDGTKLYAGITAYRETDAQELLHAVRAAAGTFGPNGDQLTARREGRHLSIFLPIPKADADRGAQFLSGAFGKATRTEF